jgi:16S rRNA (cytidine1402-2'-O)-methyltransferase
MAASTGSTAAGATVASATTAALATGATSSSATTAGGTAAGLGTLYVVPTPIGNIGDITTRAIDVLRAAAIIAAEDTRKARTLLRVLDIKARLVSYYDFNEQSRSEQLLRQLRAGRDVALISDAGTPLLNDPGYRIVSAAIGCGARVCPLPGPSAALTALIGSGLPSHRFEYVGFLPRKPTARRAAIGELAGQPGTLICYEAPHRLRQTLADLREVLGDRKAALARNLTKRDEEYLRGPISVIEAELAARAEIRGEYTLLIGAAAKRESGAAEHLADQVAEALLRHGIPPHVVREVVKDLTGLPRNRVYQRIQAAREAASQPAPGD